MNVAVGLCSDCKIENNLSYGEMCPHHPCNDCVECIKSDCDAYYGVQDCYWYEEGEEN